MPRKLPVEASTRMSRIRPSRPADDDVTGVQLQAVRVIVVADDRDLAEVSARHQGPTREHPRTKFHVRVIHPVAPCTGTFLRGGGGSLPGRSGVLMRPLHRVEGFGADRGAGPPPGPSGDFDVLRVGVIAG